mmetsp:Transcript_8955/g.20833  ORF Transcript_8955/g.20833 Transcript_8955/m.20833 type:complete len:371 (+) Transcript_8955:49-1161(+)
MADASDKECVAERSAAGKEEERSGSSWSGIPGDLDPQPSAERITESLTHLPDFFEAKACNAIESCIDEMAALAAAGGLCGPKTVDRTPLRTKYFFGKGYTYGQGRRGSEELLPEGEVDPIPEWMRDLLVKPLEEAGILERGWVDSVVMNDYRSGSSIVAHVDPPSLFERPVVTVSFFCKAYLVFGASFDPCRRKQPVHRELLERGSVLMLRGYAADAVTHGIRPEDLLGERRVSLVLRHVSGKAAQPTKPAAPLAPLVPQALVLAMQAASWGTLIAQVQGFWISARTTYAIRGWTVTAPEGPSRGASVWPLVPTPYGLCCQDLVLDAPAVFSSVGRRLTWRVLGNVPAHCMMPGKRPKNGSPWTWLRLEN